jgi:hypothetical protein
VAGLGDITLTVYGSLAMADGVIESDVLTIDARNAVTVTTNVSQASIRTRVAGNVSITQTGLRSLALNNVYVMDGSLTVAHPRGRVVLQNVELGSNRSTNSVTVTAGGDIAVGRLYAGLYAATSAAVLAPGAGAESGMRSAINVSLTSGGAVTEYGSDADVDLVAGNLSILAATGISGLETAVNELESVRTTAGSIELTDLDGYAETTPGLVVRSAAGDSRLCVDQHRRVS